MGRTSDARQKILGAARSLIEGRGYSALGVAEICKAAGVPKGGFSYFFESKEALALAVVDEHWAAQRQDWETVLGTDADPLRRLCGLFEQTEAGQRAVQKGCGTVSGCLFGNLALELSNHAEPVRGRLQEIFDVQVDMVEAVVAEARDRGDVTVSDPRAAARAVVAQRPIRRAGPSNRARRCRTRRPR